MATSEFSNKLVHLKFGEKSQTYKPLQNNKELNKILDRNIFFIFFTVLGLLLKFIGSRFPL